jgi:hypothetical protein
MKLKKLIEKNELNEGKISDIIGKIFELLLSGKSDDLYKKYGNNEELKSATDNLNNSIKRYKQVLKKYPHVESLLKDLIK